MYKIRVILDTKEDVIRTLAVNEAKSLEGLHFSIANAFGFDGQEMASFYRTDNEWNQGEEIPLFNMAEAGEGISMASCGIKETLPQVANKLIYVYDFLHMHTFYVEVVEITDEVVEEAKIIMSVGEMPVIENTELSADDLLSSFEEQLKSEFDDDDFKDDFGGFESLDDIDLDKY